MCFIKRFSQNWDADVFQDLSKRFFSLLFNLYSRRLLPFQRDLYPRLVVPKWLHLSTPEFLELFLRNLLLNENHPLHNRTLHISGVFKAPEKANIEKRKANIESEKANIQNSFTAKTAEHVCKLFEEFGFQTVFGRSDVQKILGLKPTRNTALLNELLDKGFVEPVAGFGKGKYRFRLNKDVQLLFF